MLTEAGKGEGFYHPLYFLLKMRMAGPTGIEPVTTGFLCLAFFVA